MKEIIWHTEKRKLSELKPSEINPRIMTEKQMEDLRKSILKFSLCDPIIINQNNVIIGGHQRIKILQEQGAEEVDVRVPDRLLTKEEEQELNIRLNKNLGEWNWDLLKTFEPVKLEEIGFTEFDLGILDDITKEIQDLPFEKITKDKEKYHWLWVEFKNRTTMLFLQKFFNIKNREIPEEKFIELLKKAGVNLDTQID